MVRETGLLGALALVSCATPDAPPEPAAPWQEGTLFEGRRRLEASAASLGTRLVVLGGFATGDREVPRLAITAEVLAYEPLSDRWSLLPEAPVSWTHAGLAGSGGALYLLGGLESELFLARREAFVLAPGADGWRELEPMLEGRERGAAATVTTPGHVFLLGGATTDGVTASCLDYSISTNRWSELPALPSARSHAAALRMDDGTLIVAGGIGAQGEPLGDVWALPPALGPEPPTWQPREPMPTRRGGCAYGTVFGQLICAGGEANGSALRVVESYDPTLNAWTSLPDMPVERAGAPGAVVAQQLFVVGGSRTSMLEPTSSLFVFNLLDTIDR